METNCISFSACLPSMGCQKVLHKSLNSMPLLGKARMETMTVTSVQGSVPWTTWTFLIPLILATVGYYLYVYCTPFARKFNRFPGTPVLPFIGNAYLTFSISKVQYALDTLFRYYETDILSYWMLHIPYLITIDPTIVEIVFSDPRHSNKSESYENSHFFMSSKGIVVSKIDQWKKDRKILFPSVKLSMYKGFLESFNKHVNPLIDILTKRFPTGTEKFDVSDNMGRCAMDIVFETIVDLPLNLQRNPELGFYEAYMKLSGLVSVKSYKPYVKIPVLYKLLGYKKIQDENMAILKKAIPIELVKQNMKMWKSLRDDNPEFENLPKKYAHLLYIHKDDTEEIFFQLLTILAAGFETTSTTINHTLFLLALNPEVQKKLQTEVDSVFDRDFERDVTFEDLAKLKYMEIVLKESMRLFVPTPILSREIALDIILDDGRVLPGGSNFLVPTWHVMRNPKVYDEPTKFIPERFLPQNSKGRNSYAYLPFSGGPRGCFGQKYAMTEMKVLLAKIMGNFSVKTERRMEDLVMHYGIVIHVVGGLPITIMRR